MIDPAVEYFLYYRWRDEQTDLQMVSDCRESLRKFSEVRSGLPAGRISSVDAAHSCRSVAVDANIENSCSRLIHSIIIHNGHKYTMYYNKKTIPR